MMEKTTPPVRQIVILATGGTIAGKGGASGENLGYTAGTVPLSELMQGISPPEGFELISEQVAQLDSKDMNLETWLRLRDRCSFWLSQSQVAGVVVTHGTDTIEESAYFLQSTIRSAKPIVLTCAMRPATSLSPDGPKNIRDALAVAANAGSRGVVVVCAGEVHSATHVAKAHPYRLNALSSGDVGPIGYVEEGELRLVGSWLSEANEMPTIPATAWNEPSAWPRVEILTSHAGATGLLIELLTDMRSNGKYSVDGFVIAATGNGSLHCEVETAALKAQDAGMTVVVANRCANGKLLRPGVQSIADAGYLNPVKARIQLMLRLLATPTFVKN